MYHGSSPHQVLRRNLPNLLNPFHPFTPRIKKTQTKKVKNGNNTSPHLPPTQTNKLLAPVQSAPRRLLLSAAPHSPSPLRPRWHTTARSTVWPSGAVVVQDQKKGRPPVWQKFVGVERPIGIPTVSLMLFDVFFVRLLRLKMICSLYSSCEAVRTGCGSKPRPYPCECPTAEAFQKDKSAGWLFSSLKGSLRF